MTWSVILTYGTRYVPTPVRYHIMDTSRQHDLGNIFDEVPFPFSLFFYDNPKVMLYKTGTYSSTVQDTKYEVRF
jgi:hypothetical protein